MKKNTFNSFFISFLILLLSSHSLFSQRNVGEIARHDAKDISYGLKLGLNRSTISAGEEVKAQIGFLLGAFGEIKLDPTISVSIEMQYSQQGCEFIHFVESYIHLNYLNIPILFNYRPPAIEGLTLKAGLQPSFSLSSKLKMKSFSYEDGFKSFDISMPIGLSYELDMGLLFDIRYNFGFLDVFDASNSRYTLNDVEKGNNMVLQFSIGYRF